MKTENRTRMMIWAIALLAVMNITTILTIIYHRHETRPGINMPVSDITGGDNASVRFSGRWFRDELDLSAEQMNRFREFNPAFRQHVRDINLQLNNLRKLMMNEMSSPLSDSARLNVLSDSVGFLHAELKKYTYRYYMNFKDICNKEQKEKLDNMFGEIFAADIQIGRYGQGSLYGRGRGRRINN